LYLWALVIYGHFWFSTDMSFYDWESSKLAVVDTEGNGQPLADLVEIAIVHVDSGQIVGKQSWLIKPKEPVTSRAYGLHGISNAELENQPTWEHIENEILEAMRGRIFVAHNAGTDLSVLKKKMPGWSPDAVIDTLRISRQLRPERTSHSLSALIDAYGIESEIQAEVSGGPHRALYDAYATAILLLKLRLKSDGSIISLSDVIRPTGSVESTRESPQLGLF
jgi:DNA polymerase III epsilon subunit-like protein